MNSTVVVILVAAIVLAGITVLAFQYFRTRRLRERFGPEYTRAVREAGDRKSAESKLEKLEKRVERLRIRAIEPADRDRFLRSGALCRQDLSTIRGVLLPKPTIFLER
jgi:predicted Holliday junction resolvase-like endonuclease